MGSSPTGSAQFTNGVKNEPAKRNNGKPKVSINGVSKKFKQMSEVYRIFSKDWEHLCDYSDEMLIEMYNSESFGTSVSKNNGFLLGKKWLNVTVKMWLEDIALGTLFKQELYDDPKFPIGGWMVFSKISSLLFLISR